MNEVRLVRHAVIVGAFTVHRNLTKVNTKCEGG